MSASGPLFWRDPALPFVEARAIVDGRALGYAKHSHETFSVGVVTGGRSQYVNGRRSEQLGAGAVVLMNPGDAHACKPLAELPWSYRMLYLDPAWLAGLQRDSGCAAGRDFRAFTAISSSAPALFDGLNNLYALLSDRRADRLQKHCATIAYFATLQSMLNPAPGVNGDTNRDANRDANHRLARAAEFINDNYTHALQLDDICAAADLSPSYLIRAFGKRFGMTPHAYLMNRRIQFSRAQLRRGHMIADVALQAGFADQAHFQRVFKRFTASTPGQYRR